MSHDKKHGKSEHSQEKTSNQEKSSGHEHGKKHNQHDHHGNKEKSFGHEQNKKQSGQGQGSQEKFGNKKGDEEGEW